MSKESDEENDNEEEKALEGFDLVDLDYVARLSDFHAEVVHEYIGLKRTINVKKEKLNKLYKIIAKELNV